MKCFYHHANDAVAICKSCNKGLCFTCAVEVENGVACKGRCEAEVRSINLRVQRGKRLGVFLLGAGFAIGFPWNLVCSWRHSELEQGGGKGFIAIRRATAARGLAVDVNVTEEGFSELTFQV